MSDILFQTFPLVIKISESHRDNLWVRAQHPYSLNYNYPKIYAFVLQQLIIYILLIPFYRVINYTKYFEPNMQVTLNSIESLLELSNSYCLLIINCCWGRGEIKKMRRCSYFWSKYSLYINLQILQKSDRCLQLKSYYHGNYFNLYHLLLAVLSACGKTSKFTLYSCLPQYH